MSRLLRVNPMRWLGMTILLLLLMPPATAAAVDEGSDECGDTSTPNLVITATNAGKDVPRLTLTVQTDKNGVPHWNVIFRDGGNVLDSLEIHRVFIKGHEGEELLAAAEEDGCNGGDEDSCGGEDEAGMIGAAIRGLGFLSDGTKVRVQMDFKDFGHNPDKPDQVRVRWRLFADGNSGNEGSGSCEGKSWIYNSGWINVLQINIHQR